MMANFDDSNENVKACSALEHIRLHAGMYIGRIGDGSDYDDGIYELMKGVIDNSVDEFMMGNGKPVEISLDWNSGRCSVRDYGRGMPLGKVVDCVSGVDTGDTSDTDEIQFKVPVGIMIAIALSEVFFVRSVREGEFSEATFEKGVMKSKKNGKLEDASERNGTHVSFLPDPAIFKNSKFHEKHVMRRLKLYASLNTGLTIVFNGRQVRPDDTL